MEWTKLSDVFYRSGDSWVDDLTGYRSYQPGWYFAPKGAVPPLGPYPTALAAQTACELMLTPRPKRKRRLIASEWTPETNWLEREAIRAEG